MIQGRRRELGLGGFPLVSLAEARAKAFAYRKVARDGGDPLTEKRRADGIPTFADAAERVWKGKNPGWRHPGHAQEWMSSLRRHVLPHIGHPPVCDVSSADVLDTLRRIWHVRPETARRVRRRISAVGGSAGARRRFSRRHGRSATAAARSCSPARAGSHSR